jgi:hypothetical protein
MQIDEAWQSSIRRTRNGRTLMSFVLYCISNPDQRFWQALRNWSGFNFIGVTNDFGGDPIRGYEPQNFVDTFGWEGRTHDAA